MIHVIIGLIMLYYLDYIWVVLYRDDIRYIGQDINVIYEAITN